MDVGYEELYHQIETKHWWFKSRRKTVLSMLKGIDKNASILDIGCSSGILLSELKEIGFTNLYGVDISEKAIKNCHTNGHSNTYVANAEEITLDTDIQFDVIISSDCLEHLEYDRKALSNWYSLLKPKGKLILFVPAFQALWSYHDEINHHYRRYTNNELRTKLKEAGFLIDRKGYWNFFLSIPAFVIRKIGNLVTPKKAGDLKVPKEGGINSLLIKLLDIENILLKSVTFPFGVSTFCIATKD